MAWTAVGCAHTLPGGAATLRDAKGTPVYIGHQLWHTRGTELVEERSPLHSVEQAIGHIDPRSMQVSAALSDMQFQHA